MQPTRDGKLDDAKPENQPRLGVFRGREVRSQSIATRFTVAEVRLLESAARRQGKNLREWAREVLLHAANHKCIDPLFVEIQSLRLLLVNALETLLRGDRMTQEQFKELLAFVKANKMRAAQDVHITYESAEEKTS